MKNVKFWAKAIVMMLVILTSGAVFATEVDQNTAKNVVSNFLIAKNLVIEYDANSSISLAYAKENAYSVYDYATSESCGFVIVSADNTAQPIIGYSTENNFVVPIDGDTNFMSNFFSVLDSYVAQINYAKKNNISASAEIEDQWQSLTSGVVSNGRSVTIVVDPLLTTTWGQGAFYNSMCPVDANGPNGHVPTGCVATAMGQIMKYNLNTESAYPGYGYYAYTSGSYPETAADFGNTMYNFAIMPNSLSSETAPGAPETAQILYDAAVSCRSIWGTYETAVMFSSDEDPMSRAFINFFGLAYSDIKFSRKMDYSDAEWHDLIQNDLILSQPVYYRGDGSIGHAWVVDGVDASNLYHMNFGWDGNNNGYYAISSIVPGGTTLTNNQMTITGIKPNDGSTITQDETWSGNITKATNVAICDAVTVTMNPGATVSFAEDCKLQVFGRLLSQGTNSDWIKFTAIDQNTGWTGIKFENHSQWLMGELMADNDSSFFSYTQVEYSNDHGLRSENFGKIAVDNCKFNNNYKTGISADGAGICAVFCPINLTNSQIYNNHATSIGGGVMMTAPNGTVFIVKGNEIYNNTADAAGGGFAFNSASGLVFEDNLVYNNQAYKGAGGALNSGSPMIRNNKIINNDVLSNGQGALYLESSYANIVNNLIANNFGTGIYLYSLNGECNPMVINNVIVNNSAPYSAGIIFAINSSGVIKNTIIYGNLANNNSYGDQIGIVNDNSDPSFDHCNIEDGLSGFGGPGSGANYDGNYVDNIDEDPLFVNPTSGAGSDHDALVADFSCQANSPCVDAGDLAGIANLLPELDLAGNPRVVDSIDIGAYELACSVPDQPSVITGESNPCEGSTQVYLVTDVAGIDYDWILPGDWTGTSTTNTITVTVGNLAGNISVTPSNGCGSGSSRTLAVTVNSVPDQPSVITGESNPCEGSTQVYLVTDVAGIDYDWILPGDWTGTSTTNTITVTVGNLAGNISVTPSNGCGSGSSRTLAVTVSSVPDQPSAITGETETSEGDVEIYSVINVAGIDYDWTVPGDWTINSGQGTNEISVTVGSVGGTIEVTPSTNCGTGPSGFLVVVVGEDPFVIATATPEIICNGELSELIAEVFNLSGDITYSWLTNNSSWTSTSQNPVVYPDETTIYTVEATNGTETVTDNVTVTVNQLVADAGEIGGDIEVCENVTKAYSIDEIENATGYIWNVTSGCAIIGGQNTNTIDVLFDGTSTGIDISVYGTGICGDGGSSTLYVEVNLLPEIPNQPEGPIEVNLHNTTESEYFTNVVDNADDYLWTLSPVNAGSLVVTENQVTIIWNTNVLGYCYLSVAVENGCGQSGYSEELEIYVDLIDAISEVEIVNINVYPNPTKDFIYIDGIEIGTEIQVFDRIGKLVFSGQYRKNLNIAILERGVYFVVIATNEGHVTKKIIKN